MLAHLFWTVVQAEQAEVDFAMHHPVQIQGARIVELQVFQTGLHKVERLPCLPYVLIRQLSVVGVSSYVVLHLLAQLGVTELTKVTVGHSGAVLQTWNGEDHVARGQVISC